MADWFFKAVLVAICGCSIVSGFAATTCKTVRVEHGRPVVVVSQNEVLLLEFLKESSKEARGTNESPDIIYCRAKYRFQVFDRATGSVTNGEGTLLEHYRIISRSATGGEVATQDDKLRAKAEELIARGTKYVETAIAEAQREGSLPPGNSRQLAQQTYSFVLGALLRAKIQNDVEVLRDLSPTVMAIIGAKRVEAAAA